MAMVAAPRRVGAITQAHHVEGLQLVPRDAHHAAALAPPRAAPLPASRTAAMARCPVVSYDPTSRRTRFVTPSSVARPPVDELTE